MGQGVSVSVQSFEQIQICFTDDDRYHFVYPSHDLDTASHVFRADDRLRLLDCAAGRPMKMEEQIPLKDVLLLRRRQANTPWDVLEDLLLLEAVLPVKKVCCFAAEEISEHVMEHEQCEESEDLIKL
ncbi:hypothetical protein BDZ85DRAFT_265874 [Elsinoe ampelina]|uniref:Uncharacterized protein n=1 Tax=Elsinoe ampelina TaxID=302913 RepID=A0A6A6G554_9PEZI|nr:hypothetical protein BDZ85DRAFT_265874 [Elsinoe ampelina]